jgi:hypothetical protein
LLLGTVVFIFIFLLPPFLLEDVYFFHYAAADLMAASLSACVRPAPAVSYGYQTDTLPKTAASFSLFPAHNEIQRGWPTRRMSLWTSHSFSPTDCLPIPPEGGTVTISIGRSLPNMQKMADNDVGADDDES